MTRKTSLQFAGFRLEPDNARLWRGAHAIKLKPKAFVVLHYLVEHAGQLVTKDELWQAVWPDVTVSDDVLTACVRDIRKALGDDPKAPQFIETVHRRGYRFIAKVQSSRCKVQNSHSAFRNPHSAIGLGGERQIVFVTGEPGIGKTTLVEAFLAQLAANGNLWIGRGQCIEHYGAGEAYLPVLEALGRRCREPAGRTSLRQSGERDRGRASDAL